MRNIHMYYARITMVLPHGTIRLAFFFNAIFDVQLETKQVLKRSRSSIHTCMYLHPYI